VHPFGIQSTTAHRIGSKQGLASPRSLYLCICEDAVHAHWYCHHLCCVQGPACLLCRCRGSACSSRVSKGYAGHLGYPLRDPLSASTSWHVLPGSTNTIKRSKHPVSQTGHCLSILVLKTLQLEALQTACGFPDMQSPSKSKSTNTMQMQHLN